VLYVIILPHYIPDTVLIKHFDSGLELYSFFW